MNVAADMALSLEMEDWFQASGNDPKVGIQLESARSHVLEFIAAFRTIVGEGLVRLIEIWVKSEAQDVFQVGDEFLEIPY